MRHRGKVLLPACALALLAGGADTPISLIERANHAFREGRVQRALELYEEADEIKPDDPEILYNWATALTASDDRGLADRLYRKADRLATSDGLRARARQNLAHSLFVTASTLASVDPQKAIELFDESAQAARAAWRLDRGNIDAARQVETSRLAAQLLRDQLRLAEQLRDLSQDQRDEAKNSAERARSQQEPAQQEQQEPAGEEGGPQEQAQPQGQPQQAPDRHAQGGTPDQPFSLPGFLQDLMNPGERPPPERERGTEPPPPSDGPERTEPPAEHAGAAPQESPSGSAQEPGASEPAGPREGEQTPPPTDSASPDSTSPDAASKDSTSQDSTSQDSAGAEETSGDASAQQRELSEKTEQLARTLRRAMDEDLVAGDREFAEAVLRAIEEARKSQASAEELLESSELEEASGAQEQAASLLDLAERMMSRGQEPQQQEGESRDESAGTPQGSEGETEAEPEGDPIAERLLMKEREERQMRQAYQRRVLRGRTPPARDW